MTAIAAIRTERNVIMGGDSAAVGGYGLTVRRDPKVFRCGRLLIGYTTSFRMAQLIRYGLANCLRVEDLVPPADRGDGFAFMVRDFIPRVRWLFKEGGFMGTYKQSGEERGGNFLVAWSNQLYVVHADQQVGEPVHDYAACGCGEDLVLGALHASRESGLSGETRVRVALETAESFSAGVRGPFTILSTDS